ncbi:MAG: hypothetical protein OXG56_06525 [Gammaproteobacteria bacterium]|nr:hypothetical protein [Gammaproteobacteria bacterium]
MQHAELENIRADTDKVNAEVLVLMADQAKKIQEVKYYPLSVFAVFAGAVSAVTLGLVAVVKLFL